MKVIEEPAFKLENTMGFDALVEREMEALEGGFCLIHCSGHCSSQTGGSTSGETTSTTTTSTTSSTTLAFGIE
jgi:hypothetical protein